MRPELVQVRTVQVPMLTEPFLIPAPANNPPVPRTTPGSYVNGPQEHAIPQEVNVRVRHPRDDGASSKVDHLDRPRSLPQNVTVRADIGNAPVPDGDRFGLDPTVRSRGYSSIMQD